MIQKKNNISNITLVFFTTMHHKMNLVTNKLVIASMIKIKLMTYHTYQIKHNY